MKIIPVIHHLTQQLTLENAQLCSEVGAYGVFLISMNGDNNDIPMLAKTIKGRYPHLKVGFNLLGYNAIDALEIALTYDLDMTWSDNPIVTSKKMAVEALEIKEMLFGKNHIFFNSVAFKYQQEEKNPGLAAKNSMMLDFIPTTSGDATGVAANMDKVIAMKEEISNYPLAIASGLDPLNVTNYIPYIEYGLVATGISKSFHELDKDLTNLIIQKTNEIK